MSDKLTNEIKRFCNNIELSIDGLKYTPILLNYNTNQSEEIPFLNHEPVSEEDTRRSAIPVMIVGSFKKDLEEVSTYVPGFYVNEYDDKGNVVESRLRVALTEKEMNNYEDHIREYGDNEGNLTEDGIIKHAHIKILGFDCELSKALEEYLTRGGEEIEDFSELVCFYHELNDLTYIDKRSLNMLKSKKVGIVLNSNKGDRVRNEDIDNLYVLVKRYFESNIRIFGVFSSRGRKNSLSKEDIFYSSNSHKNIGDMAFHTDNDPASDKVGKRFTGNTVGWLPTLDKDILQTIIMGNIPFMTFTSKQLEGAEFNSDPLYNVKVYIVQKSRKITSLLKNSENKKSYLNRDEIYILDNSDSIIMNTKISSMYSTKFPRAEGRAPRPISYKDFYKLYFINFSSANLVLKNKGVAYEGKVEQFLNFILPVSLTYRKGN